MINFPYLFGDLLKFFTPHTFFRIFSEISELIIQIHGSDRGNASTAPQNAFHFGKSFFRFQNACKESMTDNQVERAVFKRQCQRVALQKVNVKIFRLCLKFSASQKFFFHFQSRDMSFWIAALQKSGEKSRPATDLKYATAIRKTASRTNKWLVFGTKQYHARALQIIRRLEIYRPFQSFFYRIFSYHE